MSSSSPPLPANEAEVTGPRLVSPLCKIESQSEADDRQGRARFKEESYKARVGVVAQLKRWELSATSGTLTPLPPLNHFLFLTSDHDA